MNTLDPVNLHSVTGGVAPIVVIAAFAASGFTAGSMFGYAYSCCK